MKFVDQSLQAALNYINRRSSSSHKGQGLRMVYKKNCLGPQLADTVFKAAGMPVGSLVAVMYWPPPRRHAKPWTPSRSIDVHG